MIKRSNGTHYDITDQQRAWLVSGRHCPFCGLHKSEWTRRVDWRCCSTDCSEGFQKLTTYWPHLRIKVFRRDGWACVDCGRIDKDKNGCNFIADHIKPIALGGPEWDINNIQTLCVDCNKTKTKNDAADIAKQRRINKILHVNQQLI